MGKTPEPSAIKSASSDTFAAFFGGAAVATKTYIELLRQPVSTDARGVAVVLYYAGYSRTVRGTSSTYSRVIRGKIIIDLPEFERVEISVVDSLGGQRSTTLEKFAPVVTITLKRKPPASAVK